MFASIVYQNTGMIMFLPCGTWACKECGPKKKAAWYRRCQRLFDQLPYLEKVIIKPTEWGAVRKTLNRAGKRYVKMSLVSNHYIVFTEHKMGGVPVAKREQEDALIKALKATKFETRPISMCWASSKATQPKEPEQRWIPLDRLDASMSTTEACENRLDELKKKYTLVWHHKSVIERGGSHNALVFSVYNPKEWWPVVWELTACTRARNDSRRAPPQAA